MTTPNPTPADVRAWLEEIPRLVLSLPIAAVTRKSAGVERRSVPASKPPTRTSIVHLLDTREKHDPAYGMAACDPERQGVLPYLLGWVRQTAKDPGIGRYDDFCDVSFCCQYLNDYLLRIMLIEEDWVAFSVGVRTIHHDLVEAVAVLLDSQTPVVCPSCHVGVLRPDGGKSDSWVCGPCGHVVTIHVVTLREAAAETGEKLSTLKFWSRSGLFTKISRDATPGGGHYDLGDIKRVIAEKRPEQAQQDAEAPTQVSV